MSFKPQLIVSSHGDWENNGLRFAAEAEAFANVRDLSMRWFAVRHIRVVKSDDPVNYIYRDHRLIKLDS